MDPPIAGFEWGEANREKCRKHGVSTAGLESVFLRPIAVFPDPAHLRGETRFKAIGKTGKSRHVLVVFTLRQRDDETLIRPISARYMHAREIKYYEEEAAKIDKR
jgi:uncharacterized DUF497 family protein